MSHLAPLTYSIKPTEIIGQGAISGKSQLERQSPYTAWIHTLDDDSLLNVFYLYRPVLLGEEAEDQEEADRRYGGYRRKGVSEHWWYKLAHVCQRWQNLILGSASYLRLSLVCTYGTPVADMLKHSPPLPLVIDYHWRHPYTHDDFTAEEGGIIFALKQSDRVHRVRFQLSTTILQKLLLAIDEEYPILEYLVIIHPIIHPTSGRNYNTALIFPESFQAPHLRHLALMGFALPIRSRLLTTAVGLVTLCLEMIHPSTYFQPNTLLHWLSFMPQLERLLFGLDFAVPNRDVERQLTNTPIMTPVTLPNLYQFVFGGVNAYVEAILYRIITPRLKKLAIVFYNQLTFSVPRLLQFINITENPRFESAKFDFSAMQLHIDVYPQREAEMFSLSICINCQYLDWQVSSAAQISNSLGQMFSAVEHLTLEQNRRSSEEPNEVNPTEWRKLLSSFRNVTTLLIDNGLVEELSRCLQLDGGEVPLELLPELQELTYSRSSNTGDAFTSFIDSRQKAGRPVTLVHRSSNPDPSSSVPLFETSSITLASSEVGDDIDT